MGGAVEEGNCCIHHFRGVIGIAHIHHTILYRCRHFLQMILKQRRREFKRVNQAIGQDEITTDLQRALTVGSQYWLWPGFQPSSGAVNPMLKRGEPSISVTPRDPRRGFLSGAIDTSKHRLSLYSSMDSSSILAAFLPPNSFSNPP